MATDVAGIAGNRQCGVQQAMAIWPSGLPIRHALRLVHGAADRLYEAVECANIEVAA
jgi:hypothetical protein